MKLKVHSVVSSRVSQLRTYVCGDLYAEKLTTRISRLITVLFKQEKTTMCPISKV